MRQILLSAAIAALAACGSTEPTTGADEGTEEAAAPVAPALLANGAPLFGELDAGGVEREEISNNRHEIAYLSDGEVAEIFAHYLGHYQDAGYEVYEGGVTLRGEELTYGGYVQLHDRGDQVMVHVSPRSGSGDYDLASTLGRGFPVYPGVPTTEYDVRPRSDGSRLVIFRIADSALNILDFYRAAGGEAGFRETNLNLNVRTEVERVGIGIFEVDDRRRIVVTVTDLNAG